MNLEEIFISDIKKNSRSILTIGESETGKTYLMLHVLKHLIDTKNFEEFHVVLPNFKNEQNNSYNFLLDLKNVFIYVEYDNIILENIMKRNKKIFFCLDDGTGKLDRYNQQSLKQLITSTRHKDITVWLIVHSSNGVISPQVRSNIKYIFLTNFENEYSLHDDIFKQYCSASYGRKNYDVFRKEFFDVMYNNKFGQVLISRNMEYENGKKVLIDLNVSKWNILKNDIKSNKVQKIEKIQKIEHVDDVFKKRINYFKNRYSQ